MVVRVTADCPLIDPGLVDQTVRAFQQADPPVDFVANRLPRRRTYPIGLDTEVCSMPALEQAWRQATEPHQREHVMPFFYEQPERFRTLLLNYEEDLGELRWTVDTPEDLAFVREVYIQMAPRTEFGWLEVLHRIRQRPDLAAINVHVEHRTERTSRRRATPEGTPSMVRRGQNPAKFVSKVARPARLTVAVLTYAPVPRRVPPPRRWTCSGPA